jgi:excisionase family DNA binding protein
LVVKYIPLYEIAGKVGNRMATKDQLLKDELLSVKRTTEELGGVSKWTIYAWLSQGKLRRTKVGSRTMIRRSELQRVIHEAPPSRPSDPSQEEEVAL